VSFTLEPGEIFACSVRNGAGKTTTLRILAGLIAPDTDRLRLNGSAWGRSPRRSCGHASAFLTEAPGLWDRLTVRDNLLVIRAACTACPRQRKGGGRSAQRFEIRDRGDDRPRSSRRA
jgi:ABC-type multidrug transport system ATPase subunit